MVRRRSRSIRRRSRRDRAGRADRHSACCTETGDERRVVRRHPIPDTPYPGKIAVEPVREEGRGWSLEARTRAEILDVNLDQATREAMLQQLNAERARRAQVTEADRLVVLAARDDLGQQEIDRWIRFLGETQGAPPGALDGLHKVLSGFVAGMDPQARHEWSARQVYIAHQPGAEPFYCTPDLAFLPPCA